MRGKEKRFVRRGGGKVLNMIKVIRVNKSYVEKRRYQIYCKSHHQLNLEREEFYRTIIKGHVLTTLRIIDFTPYGYDLKTAVHKR